MTSFLVRIYIWLCTIIPGFRKITRKWMYQYMAWRIKHNHWTYMNYGYSPIDQNETKPMLDTNDEVHRLSFQLYHHLANEIDLEDKHILEVGSGRGGGASMIKKYHKPKRVVGLDYSSNAVKLCNKYHGREGIYFVTGDAENLPFTKESFDAVINVESSHCYDSMDRFLAGVHKVLKPGGHFLFTDFRDSKQIDLLDQQIQKSGLKVIKKRDITQNVVQSLDEDHDRKIQEISRSVPKFFVNQFREFAGVKDSQIYNEFKNRESIYISYVLQKED